MRTTSTIQLTREWLLERLTTTGLLPDHRTLAAEVLGSFKRIGSFAATMWSLNYSLRRPNAEVQCKNPGTATKTLLQALSFQNPGARIQTPTSGALITRTPTKRTLNLQRQPAKRSGLWSSLVAAEEEDQCCPDDAEPERKVSVCTSYHSMVLEWEWGNVHIGTPV